MGELTNMCGIAGLFSVNQINIPKYIIEMTNIIRHRGPDDEGIVCFEGSECKASIFGGYDTPGVCYESRLPYTPKRKFFQADPGLDYRIALGHRRLSILDVSPGGHQPMSYQDRYWIVYNGEIYNYIELKIELERKGYHFISESDTEVILAAFQEWGALCLNRFNGMFSFIIFDRKEKRIFVARDRFGVKPLYFWQDNNGVLAFASEIKQFTVLPGWQARVNEARAYDFLNWGITDHTNETLFRGVYQLRGGEYLDLRLDKLDQAIQPEKWYEIDTKTRMNLSFEEACEQFKELFSDAVRVRLRADVPVGTGLSGGLDSSSIVCMMNQQLTLSGSMTIQNTFSACSKYKEFDEREFIKEVVNKTGVCAHYTTPEYKDLFSANEKMTWHQDEPFNGCSIYAEWEVFKLVAGTPVKVTLDGHGADEILAGYHTFFGAKLAGLFSTGNWLEVVKESAAEKALHGYGYFQAAKKMALHLLPLDILTLLQRRLAHTHDRPNWINVDCGQNLDDLYARLGGHAHTVKQLSIQQLLFTSLPKQLHWVDRDSMAHSIESRAPFLDYRLVEFVLNCPDEFKLKHGLTKRLLRKGLEELLPAKIAQRMDKMGFVTPEEIWVRRQMPKEFQKELRNAVDKAHGILNEEAIRYGNHIITGQEAYDGLLWRFLSFGTWMDVYKVGR